MATKTWSWVACCVVFVGFLWVARAGSLLEAQHAVVIDCGSSGSRVHIFGWVGGDVFTMKRLGFKRITPGLASFETPGDAVSSIRTLLEHALDVIPEEKHKETLLFVKATSGIRTMLWFEAEELIMDIRETCRALYPFAFLDDWISVASGEEEAMYDWISVNFARGVFSKEDNPTETYGVLDLGGGATQVSFVPIIESPKKHAVLFNKFLSLGRRFRLYAHSYSNNGVTRAFDKIQKELLKQGQFENPCLPKGYLLKCDDHVIRGSGTAEQCRDLIKMTFEKEKTCRVQPCSINGQYQPTVTTERLVAIEGFYYNAQFFQLGPKAAPIDFAREGSRMIEMQWEEIVKQQTVDEYLPRQGFTALFISALLSDGYGIDPTKEIFISSTDFGWSIGTVVYTVGSGRADQFLHPTLSLLACGTCAVNSLSVWKIMLFTLLMFVIAVSIYVISCHNNMRYRLHSSTHSLFKADV
eukprot:TRINITY_DN15064_c0_g1_i1.p1 TRINITY_DN15064_c0_g1~~TRINITY_DN15064_c0_g1_i1.p1  ORF type:complete len:507 (-),score=111.13 TRINITY_DN15064_c0_g1_i1:1318-2724(-)